MNGLFTVVIAEKEYIDSIREYEIFLKPFIDRETIAFCEWNRDGQTLTESVPTLVETVARREHLRALVLCGEEGLNKRNPFHLVEYHPPEEDPFKADDVPIESQEEVSEETLEDPTYVLPEKREETERKRRYFAKVFQAKQAAFEEAARLPLTRLMTYLCEAPMISEGRNGASEDVEFAEYQAEAQCKQEIRQRIVGEEKINIFLPEEIYCIAKRTFQESEHDILSSWTKHVDHQYSKFYDWNLYFDKMRYLVFDILPASHQNYTFDYIRFLYTLLLFAGNEVPGGCLRPNRVYYLNCENDEPALRRLIASYDEKLRSTQESLEEEIRGLTEKTKERITDYEVNALFCSPVNVPVTLDQEFDQSGLFADKKGYGLAGDCPETEESVWNASYRKSEKTLHKLLKQPRRSLKRAVENMGEMNLADTDRVKLLNEFQIEDVQEFTNDSELNMVSVQTSDVYDLTRFREQMEEEDKLVKKKLETRMSRKTTVLLGAVVLAANLLCFLPMFLGNPLDAGSLMRLFLLIGGVEGLLLLVGFVCLFFLRSAVKKRINDFNVLMQSISDEISASLAQFSRYLSHACNVMRGFSAINFYREHEDVDTLEIRVRKKHLEDIRGYRERLREIFGVYFTDPTFADPLLTDPYDFNFRRPVDFDYSLPFMPGEKRQIEYLQSGNEITVPVNFVHRLTVRQEELYD